MPVADEDGIPGHGHDEQPWQGSGQAVDDLEKSLHINPKASFHGRKIAQTLPAVYDNDQAANTAQPGPDPWVESRQGLPCDGVCSSPADEVLRSPILAQ